MTILSLFIANTITTAVCSIAIYLQFYFSKFFKKLKQIATSATGQSLFIVLKDNKSEEVITLTRESYENVVCQKALEQGYKIENVSPTEGTDFSCKPAQLVITKFIDFESKKELLSGVQHVRNTDLHLKLIDLDPSRGIRHLPAQS